MLLRLSAAFPDAIVVTNAVSVVVVAVVVVVFHFKSTIGSLIKKTPKLAILASPAPDEKKI